MIFGELVLHRSVALVGMAAPIFRLSAKPRHWQSAVVPYYGIMKGIIMTQRKPMTTKSIRIWGIVIAILLLLSCGGADPTPNPPNSPPETISDNSGGYLEIILLILIFFLPISQLRLGKIFWGFGYGEN